MPFNFPIEQNRFGDLFAQGIANAINMYRQGQQIQRQRALDAQQKTLTEYQNPGLHFGESPKTPPVNLIDTAEVPSVQRTPDGTPMDQYFRDVVSSAVKSPPAITGSHPSRVDFSGGWFDPDEAMQIMAPRMAMAGREAFLKSFNEAAGKVAGDPGVVTARDATSALARSRAHYYDNQINKPPTPHFVQDDKGNFVAINPVTLQPTPLGIKGKTPATPQEHFTALQGTDPNTGQPIMRPFNTQTGTLGAPLGINPKATGTSGLAAMTAARIKIAANMTAKADDSMTKYEDDLLHGRATIGGDDVYQLKLAMSESPAISSAAEAWLNKHNPRLAEYFKNSKIISTSERLVSPRGGSNALMGLEGMLSAVGPNPDPRLIQQVRDYRHGLRSGLEPETPTPTGTPLQLKYDAAYQHLKAQGKKDADIKAIIGERP